MNQNYYAGDFRKKDELNDLYTKEDIVIKAENLCGDDSGAYSMDDLVHAWFAVRRFKYEKEEPEWVHRYSAHDAAKYIYKDLFDDEINKSVLGDMAHWEVYGSIKRAISRLHARGVLCGEGTGFGDAEFWLNTDGHKEEK